MKGRYKSKYQKSTIKNIKTFSQSREKVIKLFDDYSIVVSDTKYISHYGGEQEKLTPK